MEPPISTLRLLLYILYGAALLSALPFDGLASMASDAVHYLLMARHLSPWGTPDAVAAQAFAGQGYPPLFPLLLALFDAGSHFARAHLLTGLLLLVSLPLLHRYAARTTGSAGIAFAITALFALSPGAWLNTLDVLSENQFLALSLVLLLRGADPERGLRAAAIDGLLLAALILTRSVGIAMLAAVVATAMLTGTGGRAKLLHAVVPAGVCLLGMLAAQFLLGAGVPEQYLRGFARIAAGEAPQGRIDAAAFVLSQLRVLGDAWTGNWLYYWSGGMVFAEICLAATGALGIAGLLLRLREGRLDAWYVAAYLGVILVWPHPGQMARFVYPVAPLLLIMAVDAAARIGTRLPTRRAILAPLLLALFAAAVLPTLAYTWNRRQIGHDDGFAHMTEFYRLPDLRAAALEAAVHVRIARDIAALPGIIPEHETVLYYEPAYIALLARRAGARLPATSDAAAIRTAAATTGAQWLLLTRIDPRHWRPGQNLLGDLHAFEGWTEVVQGSLAPDGKPASLLLRIRN